MNKKNTRLAKFGIVIVLFILMWLYYNSHSGVESFWEDDPPAPTIQLTGTYTPATAHHEEHRVPTPPPLSLPVIMRKAATTPAADRRFDQQELGAALGDPATHLAARSYMRWEREKKERERREERKRERERERKDRDREREREMVFHGSQKNY